MKLSSSLDKLLKDAEQKYFNPLPQTLTYHNFEHTQLVVNLALMIAEKADLGQNESEMLYAAAVMHDTGYAERYRNNEKQGAKLARLELPLYGFSADQIERVVDLIFATDYEFSPKTHLERFIKDADLGYIGHQDFLLWSDRLLREYRNMNVFKGSDAQWIKRQIDFLSKHHFYTQEGITLFEGGKKENILLLRSLDKWPF